LFSFAPNFRSIHVVVQREVAERIVSRQNANPTSNSPRSISSARSRQEFLSGRSRSER
jgi:16S rRNA A1518/A1519 N6-dimethyltransferase RsmA/KsgA/DIM1 with predicted DNA glycosylase/AP lyase activity